MPKRHEMTRAVLADAIPVRGGRRARLRRRGLAGAFRAACGGPRCQARSCRSATAPARSAAARRRRRWSSAGSARMARATAPAACAARCGTMSASNARCAARPRASRTRRSMAARERQGRDLRDLPRLCEDPAPAQGPGADIVADDVASLGLDLLMREDRVPARRRQPVSDRLLRAARARHSEERRACAGSPRSTRCLRTDAAAVAIEPSWPLRSVAASSHSR